MAFGLVGQTSSQTTHGVAIAQGRQRPQSKKAVPILTRVPLPAPRVQPLVSRRERRDRAGGADLAAARAARLAPAAARDEHRRVEPLEPRGRERGLERRGRAGVHAGPAPDAAAEELGLGQGARRADRLGRGLGRGGAQQGQQRGAGERGADELAPRQVDAAVRRRRRGEGPVGDRVLRADRDAVEADVALGDAVPRERLVRALAVPDAAVAVVAEVGVHVDAEDGGPGAEAEESAERAERPAPPARDPAVGGEEAEEDRAGEPGAARRCAAAGPRPRSPPRARAAGPRRTSAWRARSGRGGRSTASPRARRRAGRRAAGTSAGSGAASGSRGGAGPRRSPRVSQEASVVQRADAGRPSRRTRGRRGR